jgi:hypothetical protein
MRISQPPTNSLSTYSCGIVGHSEYSLIPKVIGQHAMSCSRSSAHPTMYAQSRSRQLKRTMVDYAGCNVPALRSWSSSTLNAVNFSGSTPCMPKICMLALENPHCGVSGVPFMNRTTGDEATALSIAERTSSESSRAWNGVRKRAVGVGRTVLARVAARKAW